MPKTIIITGANGNLGTATVKKFLEEGYRVVAVDHSGSHLSFAENNSLFELINIDLLRENDVHNFVQQIISKHQKIYSLIFETAFFLAKPLFQDMMKNDYGRIILLARAQH